MRRKNERFSERGQPKTVFFAGLLPVVLIIASLVITFSLRGLPLCGLLSRKKRHKSFGGSPGRSFSSAMMSLAGTLGVGNITGVTAAISVGGPGALFWMWIAALAAMPVRFAEVLLSVKYGDQNTEGGAVCYLKNALFTVRNRKNQIVSSGIAAVFSVLCIIASLTVGNFIQIGAAAGAMDAVFAVPAPVTGILAALVIFPVAFGGSERVRGFSTVVIPILSGGYILLSLAVIVSKAAFLPSVFGEIFAGAFEPLSAVGGISGSVIARLLSSPALRLGTARGLLSNEAGCGTAAFAHAGDGGDAVQQGYWGVFEVFVDTILLCTLTGLTVLLSPVRGIADDTARVINAFSDGLGGFGSFAAAFLAISVFIYAVASAVCWAHYGMSSISALGGGKKAKIVYLLLFSLAAVPGAILRSGTVWELADLSVALMTVLNTVSVMLIIRKYE